ncbi:SYF2 splicing factor-domain-containing protein [Phycomyces nitens]|nr:SYF2 splicing factor-domain-containing protein [Phycomyces nitens]
MIETADEEKSNIVESGSNDENEDDEEDVQPAGPKGPLAERMEKLKALKRRRVTEVEQGNRRDRNLEFQRSKENPRLDARNERKKQESLKLKEKQDAKDNGEDYDRKQFWKYSAESVDSWEKKMAKKSKMANNGFTDHTQAAHKKYIKLMSDFKPDMNSYAEKKLEAIERAIRNGEDPSDFASAANNLEYASVTDKTSKEAIDRLAEDTKKQIIQRETRSRDRKETSDDISWINEKNRVFNQKIARFYDKYTKEIRENLERGTAL